MDILTELLEAPDTIKLIADTLAKVRKPILLMKQLAQFLVSNKGLKGTAQYADRASEFWLQYRYGFLPLYLTVLLTAQVLISRLSLAVFQSFCIHLLNPENPQNLSFITLFFIYLVKKHLPLVMYSKLNVYSFN